jgi:cell wall-associated NlpC family hydrolase
MRGRDVRVLQGYLGKVGLRTKVDGQFGPATTSSVRRWELRNLRPTDGKVPPDDAQALRDQVDITSMGGAQYRPPAPPVSDPGPAPDPNQPPPEPQPPGPAGKVTFAEDGTAVAPVDAPPEVKAMIAAANQIHAIPYKYGGGHAPYRGNKPPTSADCSGSVSWVLHAADKLDNPLDSSGLMTWGEAGKGQWVTVYSNPGHVYMTIGDVRFDTSGMDDKTRWDMRKRSSRGYTIRHPEGL